MIAEDKISRFIALLIDETSKGKLKWKTQDNRSVSTLEGEQNSIGLVYKTKYKDKNLQLYKYSQPIQVDEFDFKNIVFFKLEFIDETNNSLWEFPQLREVFDLYQVVQIKTSNIDDFINENLPDISW